MSFLFSNKYSTLSFANSNQLAKSAAQMQDIRLKQFRPKIAPRTHAIAIFARIFLRRHPLVKFLSENWSSAIRSRHFRPREVSAPSAEAIFALGGHQRHFSKIYKPS